MSHFSADKLRYALTPEERQNEPKTAVRTAKYSPTQVQLFHPKFFSSITLHTRRGFNRDKEKQARISKGNDLICQRIEGLGSESWASKFGSEVKVSIPAGGCLIAASFFTFFTLRERKSIGIGRGAKRRPGSQQISVNDEDKRGELCVSTHGAHWHFPMREVGQIGET